MEAEILWCIQMVLSHKSLHDAEKDIMTMVHMLPFSNIAQKMQLERGKIGYTTVFSDAMEKDMFVFQNECKTFIKTVIFKLLRRSPLTYTLTGVYTSLDHTIITSSTDLAKQCMDRLLGILIDYNKLMGTMADAINRQYQALLTNQTEGLRIMTRSKHELMVFGEI